MHSAGLDPTIPRHSAIATVLSLPLVPKDLHFFSGCFSRRTTMIPCADTWHVVMVVQGNFPPRPRFISPSSLLPTVPPLSSASPSLSPFTPASGSHYFFLLHILFFVSVSRSRGLCLSSSHDPVRLSVRLPSGVPLSRPFRSTIRTLHRVQKLQGEDMLSPAAFQPKPEVSDLEMAGGEGLSGRDLLDEPSTERKVLFRCLLCTPRRHMLLQVFVTTRTHTIGCMK